MKVKANSRLYRYVSESDTKTTGYEDILEEVEVVRVQNEEVCSIKVTKGREKDIGSVKKITEQTLLNLYTLLTPAGYVTFNIVTVNKLEDVMVTIIRDKDKHEGAYAICRQSALDLFAKQISPDHVDYTGLSISKESCPSNVNFDDFFACDKVTYSEVIAYYVGDKLDKILSCVRNTKKYNNVLMDLFYSHCLHLANNNKLIASTYEKKDEVDGYCKTLQQLLEMNNFKYDLYRSFDIIPTNFPETAFCDGMLSNNIRDFLSSVLMRNITKHMCLRYDTDIYLGDIKRDYCLVADRDENVWVVAYVYEGSYITDLSNESKENLSKLQKLYQSESVQLAYDHLQFNDRKYKK